MRVFSKAKNTYAYNVITLIMGTGISQAIPIALSPLLTRIYSPDDFGLFGLYVGLASVLIVLSTGRYELAIMLPKKESDAAEIVKLSIFLVSILSLLTLVIVLILGREISILLGNEKLHKLLYLLPISILLNGSYQSLNYWINRKKYFNILAKNRVLQSTVSGFSQSSLGLLGYNSFGLLMGMILGQLLTLLSFVKKIFTSDKKFFQDFKRERIINQYKRYINFPRYDIPTALLNTGAMYAPNVLFNIFFLSSFAGYFYLTQRVLQTPITLVARSVLDVFKEEASKTYRNTGQAKLIYIKTFKWLMIISIPTSIILFFTIEDLFQWVFGPDWVIAGKYSKIMLPALTMRFIANPLGFMIYIAEKQVWNLVTMISLAIGILLSFYLSEDHYQVIKNITIIYFCYYLIHIFLGALFAGVFKKSK